jgi:hypothetical protein
MKFTTKILALAAVITLSVLTAGAQLVDLFNGTRIEVFNYGQVIQPNATLTTNGANNSSAYMGGFTGRGILLASGVTNTGTAGQTLAFKIEQSPDNTNWYSVSNFATITSLTAVNKTNLMVLYNGAIYAQTNNVATNSELWPFTFTTPSAPLAGFNTPYPLPVLFTNAAGFTTVPPNGQPVAWSVKAEDLFPYWHIIWQATGNATNGISPSNAVVNAVWIGSKNFAAGNQ